MGETSSDRFPDRLLAEDRAGAAGPIDRPSTFSPAGSPRPDTHRMLANVPAPPASRWHPQHWRLRDKLLAIGGVPLVLAGVLGVMRIVRSAHASRSAGIRDAIIIGVLWLAALILLVVVARSIMEPLRRLRGAAFDVADRRLPAAIEKLRTSDGRAADIRVDPVPVYTREDVGQVARAFDAVHSEAVRLAGEQARLRANVNDMFLNLSRRSQGLVERQLRLIDELELGEQDSERLGSLFRLDHLATRMRRNGENLLVLAGADLRQRSGEPVPILDVLRASVSEIEDYQRVAIRPLPRALVHGRAVNDIVHLVAEVLDNATAYSDPESQVSMTAQYADGGGLSIDIRDAGTGIPAPRLFEINQRLAAEPTVDVAVSRQMGLFVVARLAHRHDIVVQLAAAADGPGTTVTVTLPKELVTTETSGTQSEYLGRTFAEMPPLPIPVSRETDSDIFRPAATTFLDLPPLPAAPAAPTVPAAPAASVAPPPAFDPLTSGPPPMVNGASHDTPIFAAVLSNWFTDHEASAAAPTDSADPATEPAAVPTVNEDTPSAVTDEPHPADRPAAQWTPAEAIEAEPPFPAPVREPRRPAGGWESVADEGWRAAAAAAEPAVDEFTTAGLPKRRPAANLVPGGAGENWMGEAPAVPGTGAVPGGRPVAPAAAVPGGSGPGGSMGGPPAARPVAASARSADTVRGRMSSYQRGLKLGRHAQHGAEPKSDAAPAGDTVADVFGSTDWRSDNSAEDQ